MYAQDVGADLLAGMVETGDAAGDGFVGVDFAVGCDFDPVVDADSPVSAAVVELDASGVDGGHGLDRRRVVAAGCATGASEEDVGERRELVSVGAVVDEKTDCPR